LFVNELYLINVVC